MIIEPAKRISGRLTVPGDKSISHRAAMLAALANGVSRISNFATSADCAATLNCLEQLSVRIDRDGQSIYIQGAGRSGLKKPNAPLNCENSGTTMRLLSGIVAGCDFAAELTGDDSLCSRPMQRIIEPLQMMGAEISSQEGKAPLHIQGQCPLKPITYELLAPSAQVKSCVLLAGLSARGRTEVIENEATRNHTELMMSWFGVDLETGSAKREGRNAASIALNGPANFAARDLSIPGDISSASYFVAAAALASSASIEIDSVGLNPTRIAFLDQLVEIGLPVSYAVEREDNNEPVGRITVRRDSSNRFKDSRARTIVEGLEIPQLIDELPLLAIVGSQLEGGIEIRNAAELRVKESDRIATTAAGLRAMGAQVNEFSDGMRVEGPTHLRGAAIDPRGDHRIAMAFAVAALLADGRTEIKNSECVSVSFPEFFDLLETTVER